MNLSLCCNLQGYSFYITILYLLVTALAGSILLCVWVGWCFKNDRFPYIWPIKVLRLVVAVFIVVFYIFSLDVFLISMDCNYLSSGAKKPYHLDSFPDVGELLQAAFQNLT